MTAMPRPKMTDETSVLSPAGLEAALREIGRTRYHHLHPFQIRLHGGQAMRGEVEAWALNRYYYQSMIPQKDAALIARCGDPDIRRAWRQRLADHDGTGTEDGGIAKWLRLTDGLGLDRDMVVSGRAILPATRFAVDAYVRFVAERSLLEAIASSLTELFSPLVIGQRVAGMLAHYPYITPAILAYFDKRPVQAKADSDFALAYVLRHATSAETQAAALAALSFKCDVLWTMLDALDHAYVTPGTPPPGAFRPKDRP
jgi:coenzyme PQQ biosynthesis protein C